MCKDGARHATPGKGETERGATPTPDTLLRAIELAQARFKTIADFAQRSTLFHLAITAFSLGFVFGEAAVPDSISIVGNIAVTVLALRTGLELSRDGTFIQKHIVEWHERIGLDIENGELSGAVRTGARYVQLCVVLCGFWTILLLLELISFFAGTGSGS